MASKTNENKTVEEKLPLFDVIKINMSLEKDGTVIVREPVFNKYSHKQLSKIAKTLLKDRQSKTVQPPSGTQPIFDKSTGHLIKDSRKLAAKLLRAEKAIDKGAWPFPAANKNENEPIEHIGVELEETKALPTPTNLSEE